MPTIANAFVAIDRGNARPAAIPYNWARLRAVIASLVLFAMAAQAAHAQGSRKDDMVFGPAGRPVAGASIRVCQPTATGTPCSPLATVYTDATLTTPAPNPFPTDGIGNYHFYAPAGRYTIQISGPGLVGTTTYPDVILPSDVSSSGSGSDISAFALTLGGNLTVAGNATISGTLSTGTYNPSTLAVSGSGCFGGPRPWIDVTCPPYNADPTGATPANTAIQAAITAACAINPGNAAPTLFFPFTPSYYSITQPQSGTNPVFTGVCQGLHLIGGSGFTKQGAQFQHSPNVTIFITGGGVGATPTATPVFSVAANSVTFENLTIVGYNQAVSVNAANTTFRNTCLSAYHTSMTNNTPLYVTGSSQFTSYYGGCLQTVNAADHDEIIQPALGPSTPAGNFVWRDTEMTGGGVLYTTSGALNAASGAMIFDNVLQENCGAPLLSITDTSGSGGLHGFTSITMVNPIASDCTGSFPLILFNAPGDFLSGVTLDHPFSSSANAIQVTAGALGFVHITGCTPVSNNCRTGVVDGSGNTIGNVAIENDAGYDYVTNSSNAERLVTDFRNTNSNYSQATPLRLIPAGGSYATLGIDPSAGLLFNNGSPYFGYSSAISQAATNTLGIYMSQQLPPTSISASAATGSAFPLATYDVYLYTYTGTNCNSGGTFGSVPQKATVTLTSGNQNIGLTWTTPANISNINSYCAFVYPSGFAPGYSNTYGFAINSPTATSTTITAASPGYNPGPPISPLAEAHRFTATSLGVNTANPQFNLDVNGGAAVNSLNGVQKAERFSGSDAAVKINACLTAASTSSGVCDARGLTGTLTATHHISIPASTTLLWGQAELTISDTGTNDAVELAGDGSSLIGYQESGLGTVPRPDTSGMIACGVAGCTTVKNPNQATRNVDWVHIAGVYLLANGASSKVIDLTSVGHSRVQDNQITVGTGGGSYGIYGDTSTGDLDSTNDIVQHNQINLESSNDVCVRLAGVFNINVIEINSCYFASANTGQEGFVYAKDSNGNYPNNSLLYGNDSEQGGASVSFGVIGYDVQGAQDITISNNRCEHIYACMRLPSDGSAVGVHMIDNYLSLSNQIQLLPNEPQAAQYAIDNNSHNWLPSQHFGLNDLAGGNLLGNASFEGWSNSTSLYYWGGVSGTTINAGGSGIYAQQTSSSSPADATTQGAYNVAIGDNATAGLGINSACIQVDATMEYTMAFRIASTSTGVKFRPGFRFYSDPNCTEADRITSASSNARVLAPANYAGQAALMGPTGPNWQSTNASLTYNNGITCNCNVTGADWNVGTASTWTPTRNFAVTFRVPDAFASTTTVTQSMRVFILENTAANPNKIYVDDVVLSQGPASPNVPKPAALGDSGNPTEYGNLTVAGSLTVGALPATLTSGTPVAGNCASFNSTTTTNVQDAGSPCPSLLTKYSMGSVVGGQAPSGMNAIDVSVIYLPNIQFSKITVDVSTIDASTSDFYSWAITDLSGNVKCSITAVNVTAGGASDQSCTQGTVTLANGAYLFAFTGNATTGKIAYSGTAPLPLASAVSSSTSASGAITFPIAVPSAGVAYSGYGLPAIILH